MNSQGIKPQIAQVHRGKIAWRGILSLGVCYAILACAGKPVGHVVDMSLNQWLGKSKLERMQIAGAPTQCTNLRTGEEVCDWVRRGPYDLNIDCPAEGIYGGHRCQRADGPEKHHLVFRYDEKGMARGWAYWGSGGKRSSENADRGLTILKQARISGLE
jgi:hypothetical protein